MATIWNARPRDRNDSLIRSEPPRPAARGWPLFGLAAAVALLAAGERPASAAPPCVRDAEKAALDIRTVQSQLMVVALTCQRQDDYDTFVQRHQPGLLGAYNGVTAHFRRLHGPAAGDQQRDQYATELANAQSQEMVRQGPSFCRNMDALVQRALAVRHAGEIARLSAARDVTTVEYPLPACTPAGTPPAATVPVGFPPAKREPATREPDEGDGRDEEILRLQNRLEQLERMLERRPEPHSRRVATARPVGPKDR